MTAQEIFDAAMFLLGENDDVSGQTDTTDTREYKVRTVGILNVLAGEVYKYSDTYKDTSTRRPVPIPIESMDDDLDLDDYLCGSVLPYGLAAELIKGEDAAMANYLYGRYKDLVKDAQNNPVSSDSIIDVYGFANEYDSFGRW